MDDKTQAALRGSIRKWENIRDGKAIDLGGDNCPLCKLFADKEDENETPCSGCPVRNATGTPGCVGTPYEEWIQAEVTNVICDEKSRRPLGYRHSAASLKAAKNEIAFLKSLLPAE